MRLIELLIRRCGMNTKKSVASEALEAFFSPPASVRGSKILTREDFRRDVPLPAIRLRDASLCGRFMQRLPHALLRFPTIKRVVDDVREDGKVNRFLFVVFFVWNSENTASCSRCCIYYNVRTHTQCSQTEPDVFGNVYGLLAN